MIAKRLYFVILLLLLATGWYLTAFAQDKADPVAATAAAEAKADEQLEIIKNALLKGDSESIRIKAAAVMLTDSKPAAREILLDALKQTENSAARVAVCKALIQSEAARKQIAGREDFVQPLLDMLATAGTAEAKLAGEATTVFKYEHIQAPLEKAVSDAGVAVPARLNMIDCLRMHPDVRAAIKLIQLVDDAESQVSAAAAATLRSLEIAVGADAEARAATVKQLVAEGPETFLQKRLMRQEAARRRVENELKYWRDQYLSALSKVYDSLADDAAKGSFLAGHLKSPESVVRRWALEQVARGRRSTTKAKLTPELGQIIIGLASDPDRDVRLATAKLLSRMGELDSAGQLLAQLKKEGDEAVKMELFVALGGACYYASLPNSGIKVAKEVRKEALDWAVKYLGDPDSGKAREGADVLRKLLEQNGFTGAEVSIYLGSLANRYKQEKEAAKGTLRAELIGAMAGLCSQRSLSRAPAAAMYKPIFDEALGDSSAGARQSAMDGLIQIDSTAALARFRKDLVADPSGAVRLKLIGLAGSVGTTEDLVWLAAKTGSNGETEAAWQAMLKIFNRSGAAILNEWVAKLEGGTLKLSDDQSIALLEIAEQKAVSEKNSAMADSVRRKLATAYRKTGDFERTAEYLLKLQEAAKTVEAKLAITGELLEAYLGWAKPELASELVKGLLTQKDIEPNDVVASSISGYLGNPPAGVDPNALLNELVGIEVNPETARPNWQSLLKQWVEKYTKAKESAPAEVSGS